MQYELKKTNGNARRGRLTFSRPKGEFHVETPAFMPVGTYGTVKGMTPEEVAATGAQILLGNTFHLWLRPGQEIMKMHGDLHDFNGFGWFPSVQFGQTTQDQRRRRYLPKPN